MFITHLCFHITYVKYYSVYLWQFIIHKSTITIVYIVSVMKINFFSKLGSEILRCKTIHSTFITL